MQNSWELTEYSVEKLQEDIESKKVIVPPYQRGIVWDSEKKSALITTIKKGFPFGSILIYVDKNGKTQLIDGLQRCTTIFEFVNKPSHFFNEQDIDNKVILQIVDLMEYGNGDSLRERFCEDIKSSLIKWIKETHTTMQAVKHMQYFNFAMKLAEKYPTLDTMAKLKKVVDLIQPMLDKYIEICDFILMTKIPVIKLMGSDEDLPEIFERINSHGATLTKYQIYNATWSGVKVKITDKKLLDIINKVCSRYDKMVEGYYEIEDYNSTELNRTKLLNIFDLCFGFGKKLCNDFPYLFGKSNDVAKVDSVGFSLVNACLGYKVSDMNQLHTHIKELGSYEYINSFLLKILECVEEVERLLAVVTTFKGNKRSIKNISINHTEMQIISIIAFVFIQKYVNITRDETTEEIINRTYNIEQASKSWTDNRLLFKKNCLKIYIMDCLNERWRGSGDKKLNSIIVSNSYYFRDISWEDFEKTLDLWNQNLNNERREEQKPANPKEGEKILLNIIYANELRAADHLGADNFDIEHLATKGLMKSQLEKINKGKDDRDRLKLPISAFGNLCYLIDADNRSKGKKTIYQDTTYLKGKSIEDIERKFTFTTKEDLEWLNIDEWDSETFKELYFEFIDNRYAKMKEKIKSFLFRAV